MGIKFGDWATNHCKSIGRFKFGGSVRDCHTYICKYGILADFNLGVAKVDHQTAEVNSPSKFQVKQYVQANCQCMYKHIYDAINVFAVLTSNLITDFVRGLTVWLATMAGPCTHAIQ